MINSFVQSPHSLIFATASGQTRERQLEQTCIAKFIARSIAKSAQTFLLGAMYKLMEHVHCTSCYISVRFINIGTSFQSNIILCRRTVEVCRSLNNMPVKYDIQYNRSRWYRDFCIVLYRKEWINRWSCANWLLHFSHIPGKMAIQMRVIYIL